MAKLYKDISCLATLQGAHKKGGRNLLPEDISIIENGAVVFVDSVGFDISARSKKVQLDVQRKPVMQSCVLPNGCVVSI